ncbi:hypothetical protein HAX54_000231, partial [Datura stramonium]|nr:hypothetical protein [Datura stramonium]
DDPLGRVLVYEEEQIKRSKKGDYLEELDATSSYVRRDIPVDILDKSLNWEKPKPSIEKAPVL